MNDTLRRPFSPILQNRTVQNTVECVLDWFHDMQLHVEDGGTRPLRSSVLG